MSERMPDEFEKKMHFSGYINTLSDTVTKMNPGVLCAGSKQEIESSDLKAIYQQSLKEWLTMLNVFIRKSSALGEQYPIEKMIGIEDAEKKNP